MNANNHIWIVDDDRSIRWVLEKACSKAGFEVESFADGNQMLAKLSKYQPDVLISDIRMPGIDGIELLGSVNAEHPEIPVIIMTAHSDLDSALSAYQGGAFEYLPKPFDVDEAIQLVQRAITFRMEQQPSLDDETIVPNMTEIVGRAPAMQEVFRAIGRLSRSNITVLINGQSGTGKELVAQALHRHSPRAKAPFIALNTAAIPKELLESELFGHERGAFTGAHSQRKGRFEQADGGTLFLDEIGDMPAELQTRLLRVLSDGEFYRVGGHTAIKVNVRIIAATHQDLEKRVQSGDFREDLFHRLNVIRIHVPALKERKEDIPKLASFFLVRAAEELSVDTKVLLPETEAYLQKLEWPGNVRQLENTCRWLTVMGSGREIHISDLPPELLEDSDLRQKSGDNWEVALRNWAEGRLAAGDVGLLDFATPKFERVMIQTALNHTGGRRQDAARLLGWGRNTLTRKIKELNLEAQD